MRALETRPGARRARRAAEGRREVRALFRWPRSPRDFQRAVKKAIDDGLSREDALRALTLSPAEIYGIADRAGQHRKRQNRQPGGDQAARSSTTAPRWKWCSWTASKYTPAAEPAEGGRGARPPNRGIREGTDEETITVGSSARRWRRCAPKPSSFKNATVMTVLQGHLQRLHGGARTARSPKWARRSWCPPGATVIDAGGQYVIPGIIDCHSHIAGRWRHQRRQRLGLLDGQYQGHHQPRGHRHLPRAGRRRDHGQHSARLGQFHRRPDSAAQDALGQGRPGA